MKTVFATLTFLLFLAPLASSEDVRVKTYRNRWTLWELATPTAMFPGLTSDEARTL
jgi:hypothetical protein